jgi:hypothetical protein
LSKSKEALFRAALDAACGEVSEAAKISLELFEGERLKTVQRELARLMEIIDGKVLVHLDRNK